MTSARRFPIGTFPVNPRRARSSSGRSQRGYRGSGLQYPARGLTDELAAMYFPPGAGTGGSTEIFVRTTGIRSAPSLGSEQLRAIEPGLVMCCANARGCVRDSVQPRARAVSLGLFAVIAWHSPRGHRRMSYVVRRAPRDRDAHRARRTRGDICWTVMGRGSDHMPRVGDLVSRGTLLARRSLVLYGNVTPTRPARRRARRPCVATCGMFLPARRAAEFAQREVCNW